MCRYDSDQLLELLAHADSSSDESSSSQEDDLAILLLEIAFAPKRVLGPRINVEDISCLHMFR